MIDDERHCGISHRISDKLLATRVFTLTDGSLESDGNMTEVSLTPATYDWSYRKVKDKSYELSNHLGNVLAVVTDRKIELGTTDTYAADVVSYADYSPYGMLLQHRHGQETNADYRFGYQGSEQDDEVKGEGNSYTTQNRMLDPRIGRWFSTDPVLQPWQSPYISMDNNPISLNDPMGDDPPNGKITVYNRNNGGKPILKRCYRTDIDEVWININLTYHWENGQVTKVEARKSNGYLIVTYSDPSHINLVQIQRLYFEQQGIETVYTAPKITLLTNEDDHSGIVQNATAEQRVKSPILAGVKDVTADIWNNFYDPATDGAKTIADPNATAGQKLMAVPTILATLPSPGGPYTPSKGMVGKRVGHTFSKHGSHNTEELLRQATNKKAPMAQGQWLDDEWAEDFIESQLPKLKNGTIDVEIPKGKGRVINADGTFSEATHARLVPSGSGVKTAFPIIKTD